MRDAASRRALLRGAGLALPAGALAAGPFPPGADPHAAWLAEHDRLCVRASADLPDDEFDALCGRIADLRGLAAGTPGRTLASARATLRMVLGAHEDDDFSAAEALVRSALATLDGLGLEGRHG